MKELFFVLSGVCVGLGIGAIAASAGSVPHNLVLDLCFSGYAAILFFAVGLMQ